MFRNYLAAALRNLVRNRLYAAINITGLAVGFAAAVLIALFVVDELSYDTWLPGHERTYLIIGDNPGLRFDFSPAYLALLAPPIRARVPHSLRAHCVAISCRTSIERLHSP